MPRRLRLPAQLVDPVQHLASVVGEVLAAEPAPTFMQAGLFFLARHRRATENLPCRVITNAQARCEQSPRLGGDAGGGFFFAPASHGAPAGKRLG